MSDDRAAGLASARGVGGVIVGVEKLVAVGLLLMVLTLTFAQVVARFIFDSPFFWTEELARYGYVWLCFVAAVAVMADRSHITVVLFERRLSPAGRLLMNVFGLAAVVAAGIMLGVGSLDSLAERSAGASPALGIPTAALYGVVYAAFLGMALHALAGIVAMVRAHLRGRPIDSAGSSAEVAP